MSKLKGVELVNFRVYLGGVCGVGRHILYLDFSRKSLFLRLEENHKGFIDRTENRALLPSFPPKIKYSGTLLNIQNNGTQNILVLYFQL